jgi:hypothetical protein
MSDQYSQVKNPGTAFHVGNQPLSNLQSYQQLDNSLDMASKLRRDDRGAQMQLDNDKIKFVQFGIIVMRPKIIAR